MCVSPIRIRHPTQSRFIDVPCGKCVECLEHKRNDWSVRLQQELKYSTRYCYFVTLTYAPEYVPLVLDGEDVIGFTLDKLELRTFIRKLRDDLRYHAKVKSLDFKSLNFKYFAVGEYGSTGLRPHYHIQLFNYPFSIDFFQKYLESAWKKGFVQVGMLHDGGCHYQAKYMIKPSGIPDSCERPFLICSNGIGKSYLTDAVIDYHSLSYNLQIRQSNQRFSPLMPRYYRSKIFHDESQKENIAQNCRDRYNAYMSHIIDTQFDGDVRSYCINRAQLIRRKEQRLYKSLKTRKL